jgi:VCBS repeat-containing protein
LNTGETLTDSFAYTISDGDLTDSATLAVTINGVTDVIPNVAPIAEDDVVMISEDAVPNTVTGDVLANDDDPDNGPQPLAVTTVGAFAGLYGTLILAADGSYSYALDNANPAVDGLNTGDTLTDSFAYTISDGDLTDSATLAVTINGVTDAEVITGTEGRDFLHGTFGNDIINAGGGRDILLGLFGDDWLCGGEEDDLLFGGMGDDIVDPGAGDDRAVCGPGDDTVIYVIAENEGARDFYYGGGGFDTLRIIASGDDRNSDAFQTDLERFEDVLARHSGHGPFGGPTFAFSALGLAVRGFEAVEIVDPADFDPCPGLPDDRLALPDLADDALLA